MIRVGREFVIYEGRLWVDGYIKLINQPVAITNLTPFADSLHIYAKTDKLYYKDDSGVEHEITVGAPYTNENAQDAIGGILDDGTVGDIVFTYDDATPKISGVVESNAITYSKMQDISAASRLLGRGSAGGAGDPEEITLGNGLSMSGTQLSSTVVGGHTIRENGSDQTARTGLNVVDTGAGTGLVTDDAANDETELNLSLYALADKSRPATWVPISVQVFTSSGTWTRPTGVSTVIVEVVGGGGGGGGVGATGVGQANSSGGGGGGGYARKLIDVSSIASATITIGAAGAAGSANDQPTGNGGSGGNSSWSDGTNTVTANGGAGGAGGAIGGVVVGGAGGGASGGNLNVDGSGGGPGDSIGGVAKLNAFGGFNTLGGSAPAVGLGAASAGKQYGGGGAGMRIGANTGATAGNGGAAGVIIVTEFE